MAPHPPLEAQQPHPSHPVMFHSKVQIMRVEGQRTRTDRTLCVSSAVTNLVGSIMVNLLAKVVRAFSNDLCGETLLINVGATKAVQLTNTIGISVSTAD